MCFYSILAQGLSFVRIHFSFPSLPHLVLISIPMLYQQVDLNVSPYFSYLYSELCSSLEPLCSGFFAVRCTSKRGDFYVTFSISTEFTTMHNGASLMSSDPNGLLMPSGQMVSIEVWSNPTSFNSGTNHPADEKGVLSEIRSETWSSGRIEVLFVFLCFKFVCVSFAVSRSYLKQMKVLEEPYGPPPFHLRSGSCIIVLVFQQRKRLQFSKTGWRPDLSSGASFLQGEDTIHIVFGVCVEHA